MPTSRISNTILDPIGSPVANAVVVAKLMPFASFRISTFTEVARQVQTTTNSSGFWQLDLERQSNINPADTTWWEVTEYIPDAKGGSRTWNISVGASDQTLYASLITPAYSQPIIISTDQATYLTQQSADARYQALSAIGATPNVIEPDDAASAGVSTSAARADHEHGIVAAAPSSVGVTSSNSEGVATSFARSDHVHDILNGAASTWSPVVTQSNTPAQTVNRATYFKIGRLVLLWVDITFNAAGTATNNIVLSNLPFTMASTSGAFGSWSYFDAGNTNFNGTVTGNTTSSVVFSYQAFGNSFGNGDIAIANNDRLRAFFAYETTS